MSIQWSILTFTSMCRNEYGKQIKSTVMQNLFFSSCFFNSKVSIDLLKCFYILHDYKNI